MYEIENVDIFTVASGSNEAICVTTNAICNSKGHAVMGKGIALTANQLFDISGYLGVMLRHKGNHVFNLGLHKVNDRQQEYYVFSFPTKNHWRDNSEIYLIERSANELKELCDTLEINRCYLPPVGCANGHLDYKTVVKPILENILDDRFTVIVNYGTVS